MILIIGNGRVANHLSTYFRLLKISFQRWNRRQNSQDQLKQILRNSQRAIVLISDRELQNFINQHSKEFNGTWFHMSGAHEIEHAVGLHPLMTFSHELYDLDFYQKIPFVMREDQKLQTYFPELPNPSFEISVEDRAKYHALCVLAGNFTTLLWQEAFRSFESVGLPRQIAHPYMSKIFENLRHINSRSPLTGPIQRKDVKTISSNLESLEDTPLKEIYKTFVKIYFPEYPL